MVFALFMSFCYGMMTAGVLLSAPDSRERPGMSLVGEVGACAKRVPAAVFANVADHFAAHGKNDACALPGVGRSPHACAHGGPQCGVHDGMQDGPVSLYCGCHAHEGSPHVAAAGIGDTLLSGSPVMTPGAPGPAGGHPERMKTYLLASGLERPPAPGLHSFAVDGYC